MNRAFAIWFAILLLAGCASQPSYEATVQVESAGERPVVVFAAKVVGP